MNTFAENEPLRILLLEDDEGDAELITRTMKTANPSARVDWAYTHRQFTELLATRLYDLVLANYRMPNWTGIEALRELRRLGFVTPLIVVACELSDERAVECVRAGAADCVLNDGTLDRLPMSVKRAIDEQRSRDATRRALQLVERVPHEARDVPRLDVSNG